MPTHTRASRELQIELQKMVEVVEELRVAVQLNTKKIAALQAQVDHLHAKGRE
jgi:hypothetical protein